MTSNVFIFSCPVHFFSKKNTPFFFNKNNRKLIMRILYLCLFWISCVSTSFAQPKLSLSTEYKEIARFLQKESEQPQAMQTVKAGTPLYLYIQDSRYALYFTVRIKIGDREMMETVIHVPEGTLTQSFRNMDYVCELIPDLEKMVTDAGRYYWDEHAYFFHMSSFARALNRIDTSCIITIEADVPVREGGRRSIQTQTLDIKFEKTSATYQPIIDHFLTQCLEPPRPIDGPGSPTLVGKIQERLDIIDKDLDENDKRKIINCYRLEGGGTYYYNEPDYIEFDYNWDRAYIHRGRKNIEKTSIYYALIYEQDGFLFTIVGQYSKHGSNIQYTSRFQEEVTDRGLYDKMIKEHAQKS